jgi:glucose-1-phosphate adenylyltransferase
VLSPEVIVRQGAEVDDSVLLDGVDVGAGAVVRRAIVDKNVVIEPGATLGVDIERDRDRFVVSPGGIVVVGKGERVRA